MNFAIFILQLLTRDFYYILNVGLKVPGLIIEPSETLLEV